eukprot:1482392-Pyramimonas_sp.AAC.1
MIAGQRFNADGGRPAGPPARTRAGTLGRGRSLPARCWGCREPPSAQRPVSADRLSCRGGAAR